MMIMLELGVVNDEYVVDRSCVIRSVVEHLPRAARHL